MLWRIGFVPLVYVGLGVVLVSCLSCGVWLCIAVGGFLVCG